jgi:hypothetical protein
MGKDAIGLCPLSRAERGGDIPESDLGKGGVVVLRSIIEQAGLTVEEFIGPLRGSGSPESLERGASCAAPPLGLS